MYINQQEKFMFIDVLGMMLVAMVIGTIFVSPKNKLKEQDPHLVELCKKFKIRCRDLDNKEMKAHILYLMELRRLSNFALIEKVSSDDANEALESASSAVNGNLLKSIIDK